MKTGISKRKPLVCRKCGHRVGYVTLKWRYHARLIGLAVVAAIAIEFIAEILVNKALGY